MNNVKTILLIGRTGNGKSTLANVITDTNEFTEGEFAVSKTRKVSDYIFEHEGAKYRIIDTVGIGDTGMTRHKVLRKLALMGYSVKDGVSQILFVTDGQLAKEAKSTYYLLEKVVFDDNIAKYTTVVRTQFDEFEKDEKCKEDKQKIIEESKEFRELIEKCDGGVVYVDNPSISVVDDEEVVLNKGRREMSRKILLNHLKSVCRDDDYKPTNLVILSDLIDEYMKKKKNLKENMDKLSKGKPRVNG